MLLSKYLSPFIYYNFFLFFFFALSVNQLDDFFLLNNLSYVIFNFTILYLGLYYYRILLYFIYFFYGLAFDLLLINEIGPHLFIFMILLIFFHNFKLYFQNYSSNKIYLIILVIQLALIFLEMIVSQIFFNYIFDIYTYIKLSILSLIISFPLFVFFLKIDNLN